MVAEGELMKTKQSARSSRQKAHLQRLRKHHHECLSKDREFANHLTQPLRRANKGGRTLSPPEVSSELHAASKSLLLGSPNQEEETSSLSSLSEVSSEIPLDLSTPKSSHSDANDDPDVPPLRRTDSIFLTKEHLEQMSKVSDGSDATQNQTCATDVVVGSLRSKRRWRAESDSGDPKTETSMRRWSSEEVHAVEKTLMAFIEASKVPRKSDCLACITASPEALKRRSWTMVKSYVRNRFIATLYVSTRKTN
ncbi:uncharacterized protein LOC121888709 [Thunnus maccoyii]|uniref:uncharacterized protein LOC121888709 n=1 Tax=Thunnus maccoyii TaxID=8240 RepID=UPI001C4AF5BE|nr:uncharacterized protein LOC121888709 [Thunnus maccoyii]